MAQYWLTGQSVVFALTKGPVPRFMMSPCDIMSCISDIITTGMMVH